MGLITYGTHVQVHELGFSECAKSYVFHGSKDYSATAVAQQLGITGAVRSGPPGQGGMHGAAGDPQTRKVRFVFTAAAYCQSSGAYLSQQ